MYLFSLYFMYISIRFRLICYRILRYVAKEISCGLQIAVKDNINALMSIKPDNLNKIFSIVENEIYIYIIQSFATSFQSFISPHIAHIF